MFIQSKNSYKCDYGADKPFIIPAGYVGPVPDKIVNSRIFNWAVNDGSITYVGQPPKQISVDGKKGKGKGTVGKKPPEPKEPKDEKSEGPDGEDEEEPEDSDDGGKA